MAKVTILIPMYNREQYICDAVESVFQQTFKDWKLVLIDDASTDQTVNKINDYLADPRVTLIRNNHNLGKVASLNKALQLVDTPYISELDSDDIFFPYTIEVLIKEAERQPANVAVFSGNMVYMKLGKNNKITSKKRIKGKQYSDKYEFLLANKVVWPRFYRTSALKRISGWQLDDPFNGRHGMDDLRVLLRLIEYYHFKWMDEDLIKVRFHDTNLSNDKELLANVKDWIIKDTLIRWGDKYEPIFMTDEEGWRHVVELKEK